MSGILTRKCHKKNNRVVRMMARGHFCRVPWPLNGGEAGGDLVLLRVFLSFLCKSRYSHVNNTVVIICDCIEAFAGSLLHVSVNELTRRHVAVSPRRTRSMMCST